MFLDRLENHIKTLATGQTLHRREGILTMQGGQSRYSTYVRARHNLGGHVFGDRYKARVVEGEHYRLALTRYIHFNLQHTSQAKALPYDEKLRYLRRYAWSSHRAYAGHRQRFNWLVRAPLLNLVSEGRSDPEAAYREFVINNISRPDEELEKAMALSSKAIGSSAFCEWAEEAYQEALAQQGSPEDAAMRRTEAATSPDLVECAVAKALETAESGRCYGQGNSFSRDVLLVAWRDLSGLSNRDIGKRLGHADGATVGKRFKQLRHDSELCAKVHTVIAGIKHRPIANCKACPPPWRLIDQIRKVYS